MSYRLPPDEIVAAIDAPNPPLSLTSPDRTRMVQVYFDAHPPVEMLARPFLRLAGIRIDPTINARRRTGRISDLIVVPFDGSSPVTVDVLGNAISLGFPTWSPDGRQLAFGVDTPDGVRLWVADASTGQSRQIDDLLLNDVAGGGGVGGYLGVPEAPLRWSRDSRSLLAWTVPQGRSRVAPRSEVPAGPMVEETEGKSSQMATFQDLLRDEADEMDFEILATTQLVSIDVATRSVKPLGPEGMYTSAFVSPDGSSLLVNRIKRPFSHRVPYSLFARTVEVWNWDGAVLTAIADLPVSDEVPRQGVPTGPRSISWQQNRPATVVWVEALDGGDPKIEVEHRDRVMSLAAPFSSAPDERRRVEHRFAGISWMEATDEGLLTEYDRDRRWRTTWLVDLTRPDSRRKVFDLSVHELYKDPGHPMIRARSDGTRVVWEEDGHIFLSGEGASPEGSRPFLDRLDLGTGVTERLWQSDEDGLSRVSGFVGDDTSRLRISRQSRTQPSNEEVLDLSTGDRVRLTDFKDPHPDLTGSHKEITRYKRSDGVELSATLHLPPGYDRASGQRLPVFIWAYPLDYSDPDTAGQVSGSDRNFTRLAGSSPLWLLTQGWAVLQDATMPIVGDPDTMNDTFVEQVVDSAKAAIDHLDSIGVADRDRVMVGGHSYGGFMTATLLAHSDLFAAGIARSGAYNRSLTPFGFQTERRTLWEAPEVYARVSPFNYAHQIRSPLLLIHGAADNNTGTHTVQSERLFQAIQGHGGTARLVLLPAEEHGYRARESVLHTVAEMLEWAERHVPPKPRQE
ncbi:MAG TPA: prolyl oligopeptidase family serine peptidase [Acidimicrobiales bacterium]|nr:prolyl oligopeptidase family serine peptidase [Acidimicrobiales bacterium]